MSFIEASQDNFLIGNCIQRVTNHGYSRRNGQARGFEIKQGQVVDIKGGDPVVRWYNQEEDRWTAGRVFKDHFRIMMYQTKVPVFNDNGSSAGYRVIDTPLPFVAPKV